MITKDKKTDKKDISKQTKATKKITWEELIGRR